MKKCIIYLSLLFVFIDQLIKYLISNFMHLYENITIIPNFLYLTYVKNDGGAFSIFSGGRWFFIGIGIIALVSLVRYIMLDHKITKLDVISYSLVISGIIGNLIDRIIFGNVIDYIHFNILGYDMAIFNFADMCIVIGALVIAYVLNVRGDKYENIHSRK